MNPQKKDPRTNGQSKYQRKLARRRQAASELGLSCWPNVPTWPEIRQAQEDAAYKEKSDG